MNRFHEVSRGLHVSRCDCCSGGGGALGPPHLPHPCDTFLVAYGCVAKETHSFFEEFIFVLISIGWRFVARDARRGQMLWALGGPRLLWRQLLKWFAWPSQSVRLHSQTGLHLSKDADDAERTPLLISRVVLLKKTRSNKMNVGRQHEDGMRRSLLSLKV